jgi:primosomal protein N' (replication factor Y)
MLVEVLPDVSGLDRTFHYAVPAALADDVAVGTIVTVALHGRRVRGFVVAVGTPLPAGVTPRDIIQVASLGPPQAVVDICRWAAWRYAGRPRPLLKAASAPTIVRRLPPPTPARESLGDEAWVPARLSPAPALTKAVTAALQARDAVLRIPPADARLPVVLEALRATAGRPGGAMVLVESRNDAAVLGRRLSGHGWPVALYPDDWAAAAAGGRVVIGTRNVALAPVTPSAIVVLDAHAESYRAERAPTFDARVIVAERARRESVPVLYVTPCPSVELLCGRTLVTIERSAERSGWPTVTVLDARDEDPHEGGYPSRLVSIVRRAVADGADSERPVVLVLNRKGRARLLACGLCGSIHRCGVCGAALVQPVRPPRGETGILRCPRCATESSAVCTACGSARLRILRPGVSHARDQLATLLGVAVAELGKAGWTVPGAPVVVGTEAVLHEARGAAMVGFLDLDQELLSPRFRASERALVLLARAARLLGRRDGTGRLVLRTSVPDHEVVRAVQTGAPDLVAEAEDHRRQLWRLPPATSLAVLSGPQASELVARLPETVEASALADGRHLVRAPNSTTLAEAMASLIAGEAGGWGAIDARVEVDPSDL